MSHPLLLWACRLVLAGLFLLAATGKILEPHDFAGVIRNFQLLPRALSNLPAITVPWIEALAALAVLAGGRWFSAGLAWITAMLAGFTLLFFYVMALGIEVDCGCFGQLGALLAGEVGPGSVLRNLVLLGMCVILWRSPLARS